MYRKLQTNRTRPLKVGLGNIWDKKVKELALKGMFAPAIAEQCALTVSQVRYRFRQLSLKPNDFRRGLTGEAKAIFKQVNRSLGTCNELRRLIEQTYKHQGNGRHA